MKAPLGPEMKEAVGPRRAAGPEVCNCDKYLKVSRERMRQLVEDSRQAPGASGTGCLLSCEKKPHRSCDAAVSSHGTAQPCCSKHAEQLEGPVLGGGTVLQVAAIPPGVLDKAKLTHFYCCTGCGKVFWEGSHFGRVVSQFRDVLVTSRDKQTVYELS